MSEEHSFSDDLNVFWKLAIVVFAVMAFVFAGALIGAPLLAFVQWWFEFWGLVL